MVGTHEVDTGNKNTNWRPSITDVVAVVALILSGANFYYQFMRSPRDLTAVVLPPNCSDQGECAVKVVVRNGGTRDEVVEDAFLVIDTNLGRKADDPTAQASRRLFEPQVIPAGTARYLSVNVAFTPSDMMRMLRALAVDPGGHLKQGDTYTYECPLYLVFSVVESDGRLRTHRQMIGIMWLRTDNKVVLSERASRIYADLLSENTETVRVSDQEVQLSLTPEATQLLGN